MPPVVKDGESGEKIKNVFSFDAGGIKFNHGNPFKK